MKLYVKADQSITYYPIYHGTDLRALAEILRSNELRANQSNETETYGVSFTRNPRESYGDCDIVLDRYELQHNYHLEPVYRDGIAGLDLAEERGNKTISPIRKYIKQLRLTNLMLPRFVQKQLEGTRHFHTDYASEIGEVIALADQYNISLDNNFEKVRSLLESYK